MKYLRLMVMAMLLVPQEGLGQELTLRYVEPFSIDLPEDGEPLDLVTPNYPEPIRVVVSGSETTVCAILSLRCNGRGGRVTIEADVATGPTGAKHDLLDEYLIKGLPRSNRYLQWSIGSERMARLGGVYPDILIQNERRFDEQVRLFRKGKALSIPMEGRITTDIRKGQTKYALIRARVSEELLPGDYVASIAVTAQGAGLLFEVPVEIEVLPFRLPGHGKILGISNDFGSPRSPYFHLALEDQAGHGMTTTRLTGVEGKTLEELEKLGFTHLIHSNPPRGAAAAESTVGGIRHYYYGVDEPQPKPRRPGRPWARMAKHVRLSRQIHEAGGRVMTSLPYVMALEMATPGSRVYQGVGNFGLKDAFEPLDWSNYGLGLQRVDRRNPGNRALFDYMQALRSEYALGDTTTSGTLRSKNGWVETYYVPLGYLKSPFFARLLFGYYLFNSHLDGAIAWTLYRPKGSPFTDEDGEDAVIAYPAREQILPTYWWEAVREGVNDLRYCRLAENLLVELAKAAPMKTSEMRTRLNAVLSPYASLMTEGRRIDRVLTQTTFRETRSELVSLIWELEELIGRRGSVGGGQGAGGSCQ